MPFKRHFRTAALALISGASLVIAIYVVGVDTIVSALARIDLSAIVLAGGLVLLNAFFALLRFRSTLRAFGYLPTWRQVVFAFTVSQVSNLVLFNIIGQSLTRAAILNSAGVPFSVSVMVTYWERLFAAGLLCLLSILSALFLFINIRIDLQTGGAYLLSLTGGIALVSIVAIILVMRSKEVDLSLIEVPRFLLRLWPSVVLTLAAHIVMLGAYAVVLNGLQIRDLGPSIFAALTIVMFAASLPISFSGWGIRELSAAQALGFVGIDPSAAVSAAIVIGLLALAVTGLGGALGLHLYLRFPSTPSASADYPSDPRRLERWNRLSVLAASVLTATLLFFQIRIPLQHSEITATIPDILALTALLTFAYSAWSKRSFRPLPSWLACSLLALSLVFLVALIIGYVRFGSNSWALMNRGAGWLISSGYVILGASVSMYSRQAPDLALKVFAATAVAVTSLQFLLFGAVLFGAQIPAEAFTLPLQGYSNNSNAFAFQLVMAATCIVLLAREGAAPSKQSLYLIGLSVLTLGICFSHSRSGLAMLAALLATIAACLGAKELRFSARLSIVVLATVLAAYFINDVLAFLRGVQPDAFLVVDPTIASYLTAPLERALPDKDRWTSIVEGLNLWLKHPVFGAGLGGYAEERLSAGHSVLVINSTPVWFMAETGLIGLIVAGVALALVLRASFHLLARPMAHRWGLGLLGIAVTMTLAGLLHDFFYQRSFWFLLGLYVAAGFALLKKSPENTP